MNNLKYAGDVIYTPKLICIVLKASLPTALKCFLTLLNPTNMSPPSGSTVMQTYNFGKYFNSKFKREGGDKKKQVSLVLDHVLEEAETYCLVVEGFRISDFCVCVSLEF